MVSTVVEVHEDRVVLSLQKDAAESRTLRQGDVVELVPRLGRIRRRFAPGQLVREHSEVLRKLAEDRDWIDAPPVGRELL